MPQPLLEAHAVTCGYGQDPVLKDVSFQLAPGDFVGVIGPNGCGKSTLIRAVTGVLRLESGRVDLEGQDVLRMPRREVARRVAVIPQDAGYMFGFTVLEMVMMGRTPHLRRLQRAAERDIARTEEALRQTDLMPLKDRKVTELSGGERQRAVIARALAQEPRLLLLDEPDSHLDIGHQIEIFDLIEALNRERGLTLLCVSHNLNLASAYCRKLMLMQQGRLTSIGAPEEIVTPDRIREVYGIRAVVQSSPVNGAPQITPYTGQTSGGILPLEKG
jgi:iron complex transport system ATP-binding protein